MGLKGKFKKGCLLIATLCLVLYVGGLIALRQAIPPEAPITWQVDLPNGLFPWAMHPLPNGNLAIVTGKNVYYINPLGEIIQVYDPVGKRTWYGDIDKSGNLYVGGSDGYIFSYNPEGEERWSVQLPDSSIVSPPSKARLCRCKIDESGNVIAQISSGELAILSPDGKVLDHASFSFQLDTSQVPIRIAEDTFAVIKWNKSMPDELTVVDLAGNEVWTKAQPINELSKILLVEDVLILNDYRVGVNGYGLDGNLLWSFTNPDPTPAIGYHDYQVTSVSEGVIYISTGKYLFALERDGNTLWQLTISGNLLPLIDNGGLLLSIEVPHLEKDQNVKWPLNQYLRKWNLPQVPYSTLSNLVELEDQRIKRRWQLPDNFILGGESGNVFGINGEVYGHTMADTKKNIPLKVYRIDLEH